MMKSNRRLSWNQCLKARRDTLIKLPYPLRLTPECADDLTTLKKVLQESGPGDSPSTALIIRHAIRRYAATVRALAPGLVQAERDVLREGTTIPKTRTI